MDNSLKTTVTRPMTAAELIASRRALGLTAADLTRAPSIYGSDLMHGSTRVVRSPEQVIREELFMQRSRDRRMVKVLREQVGRARRRRSKATPVPLDVLDQLLTRIEGADT